MTTIPLLFALRYFISRKKRNFINIISNLSVIAIALSTMALIIVLSAFNGINDLIRSKHNQWDADLKIVPKQGKTFVYSKDMITQLAIPEITTITEILEDNAYVQYNENEVVAKVKGASSNYSHRIKPFISEGEPILYNKKQEQAIIGDWIGNVLNASTKNDFYLLQIWYPKHNTSLQIDPNQSLHKEYIRIGGVINTSSSYNYIITPLSFTQRLMGHEHDSKLSYLEVTIKNNSSMSAVKQELKKRIGKGFSILDRDEQYSSLYKTMRIEKLVGFLTFSFILLIASLNIFFALTMLVIDKKKDIAILFSMGATKKTIRYIFLLEGGLLSLSGSIIGIILGIAICLVQQEFGFVKIGLDNSDIFNSYPIRLMTADILYTLGVVLTVTWLASLKPAQAASSIRL